MNKTALITGGNGYIGIHLIRNLLQYNYTIIAFDICFSENFIHEFHSKVIRIEGNIVNYNFEQIIQLYKPTHIFHLAGLKNRTNKITEFISSIEVNYKGTLNLLNSLINNQTLEHVVIIGTSEEYGSAKPPFSEKTRELPNSAYGLSKLTTTRLGLLFYTQYALPITILRPSIAYGPNQGNEMFLPALINTLKSNIRFEMTEGKQFRDFIYIDDLVEAIRLSSESNYTKGEILNVGYGKSEKLCDVAKYAATLLDKKSSLLLGKIPYRKHEIMNYTVCIDKIKKLIDWEPKISIYEGLKKIIK